MTYKELKEEIKRLNLWNINLVTEHANEIANIGEANNKVVHELNEKLDDANKTIALTNTKFNEANSKNIELAKIARQINEELGATQALLKMKL